MTKKSIFQTIWTKNTVELKIYLVWLTLIAIVWRWQFALKFFAQNIWQENITNYLCCFHKFLVQDHLYEHFCTLKQFYVVSGFACVALIYFFFIIKLEPSVGETLIEIASAVAKQTKKVWFSFFQNILPATIFYFRQRDISKPILNLVSE